MPERYTIHPIWILLVAALAVVGATLVRYKLLETQQRVEAIQTELKRTGARSLELEQHAVDLSFDREEAVRQRLNVQDKLNNAHREIRELQSRLNQSSSVIKDLKNHAVKTRLEIVEKQSRLDALQSEVESLKQSLDATKIKNANAERNGL
jgi:chromosome segregation ATPase